MTFLKWVGGKARIARAILEKFPKGAEVYFEPFLGGGSILIQVLEEASAGRLKFERYIAADLNGHLIDAFIAVRDHVESLISELCFLEQSISKEDFYRYREQFNSNPTPALFIYLNKTCFRGLYRENKKGEFNVPFGNYKKPLICPTEELRRVSRLFNEFNVAFEKGSFNNTLQVVSERDFVYLDPPYVDTFNGYTSDGFNSKEFFDFLTEVDCPFVMSNLDTPQLEEIFGKRWRIQKIEITEGMKSTGKSAKKLSYAAIRLFQSYRNHLPSELETLVKLFAFLLK
jgi:DNA adenine methylase